ncbi:hypothetical protein BpHYR1_010082 [Brachionus plicatilis]|uniref:Uncharacterized protein n=1 Tax=Brachionus plicatilis TaxID=10195 RepID=A0A3M7QRW3_BRAPC|nr:hypothetical protein BpHYR1_010082 [Brachionus plicatilis]
MDYFITTPASGDKVDFVIKNSQNGVIIRIKSSKIFLQVFVSGKLKFMIKFFDLNKETIEKINSTNNLKRWLNHNTYFLVPNPGNDRKSGVDGESLAVVGHNQSTDLHLTCVKNLKKKIKKKFKKYK